MMVISVHNIWGKRETNLNGSIIPYQEEKSCMTELILIVRERAVARDILVSHVSRLQSNWVWSTKVRDLT